MTKNFNSFRFDLADLSDLADFGFFERLRLKRLVLFCALVLGLIFAPGTASVRAQSFFDFWSSRTYSPGYDYREHLSHRDIRRILRRKGYSLSGSLRRNGKVYVADVRNRRGRSGRVIVDGMRGDILQWFEHKYGRRGVDQAGPPRPRAAIGRGSPDYSPPRDLSGRRVRSRALQTSRPRQRYQSPSAVRNNRTHVSRDRSRTRMKRTVSQKARAAIVSRALPPPVNSDRAPGSARPGVIKPVPGGQEIVRIERANKQRVKKQPAKSRSEKTAERTRGTKHTRVLPAPAKPAPVTFPANTARTQPKISPVSKSSPVRKLRKMKVRRKRNKPRVVYAGPGAVPHSGPPKPLARPASK